MIYGGKTTAFHYGAEKKTVVIPILHVDLNRGISIPTLSDWDKDVTVTSSSHLVSNNVGNCSGRTTFIVMCSQKQDLKSHLLIFRAMNDDNKLVSLRATDVGYMDVIAEWQVSHRLYIVPKMKRLYSFFDNF